MRLIVLEFLPVWLPVLFAPVIGSFLSVLVVRLPKGENWIWRRSACSTCSTPLSAIDLVPLLGFAKQSGRCRRCGIAISWLYPGLEIAALLIALWAVLVVPQAWLWPTCLLGWSLLALAVIDWRHFILPDLLTFFLLVSGLAILWIYQPHSLLDHVIGVVAGYVAFAAFAWLYARVRGRQGLGLGDAKLLSAGGAWLSWQALPDIVMIAAVSALAFVGIRALILRHSVKGDDRLAFGPFLCLAIWLMWLYGPL